MKKTIFITGASSGLGLAVAKLFHRKGWKVIATMREPAKDSELKDLEDVTVLSLDVADPSQIDRVYDQVTETDIIDVVFNNAGNGMVGGLEYFTDEDITEQINTNLLGAIRVIKAFIPHFKRNKSGLFMTTTSIAAFTPNPLSSVYNAAKWGLEGLSESLSYDLKQFNIHVKTIVPGGIISNFAGSMKSNITPEYGKLMESLMQDWFKNGTEFSSPELIAETVYEAATDGKDQLRYVAGIDAQKMYSKKLSEGAEQFRTEMTKKLYA
jgi:NAD(P)-dependent dehydrogenase (short-subunit alcohol dehydrogenase family)